MTGFVKEIGRIFVPAALGRLARRIVANDILPLAGQLAYFFVLFLFPFLVFMVSLLGLVISNPEPVLVNVAVRMEGLLPQEAITLVQNQLRQSLTSVSSQAFIGSILFTIGVGSAAAEAISDAANRSYGVQETRPFWKVRGVAVLLIFGFMLLIIVLVFLLLSSQTGDYLRRALGAPDTFLDIWTYASWAIAFIALTLALDVLYYLAPNVDIPFRWITPGGFIATILLLISSQILRVFVANFRYDLFYGQLGTGIVLLVWLYVTGLVVLIGLEINAVLARLAEERLGIKIIKPPNDQGEES